MRQRGGREPLAPCWPSGPPHEPGGGAEEAAHPEAAGARHAGHLRERALGDHPIEQDPLLPLGDFV